MSNYLGCIWVDSSAHIWQQGPRLGPQNQPKYTQTHPLVLCPCPKIVARNHCCLKSPLECLGCINFLAFVFKHGHRTSGLFWVYLGWFCYVLLSVISTCSWLEFSWHPPRYQLGKLAWQRHSRGDFRLQWPLATPFDHGQRTSGLVGVYLG